jgi:hypothetical protein
MGTTSGSAHLLYVTVADNGGDTGGGIHSPNNTVRIQNTLLAGNNASTGPDCAPGLVSEGHNLIGSLADCALTGDPGGNVTGESPQIDVLTGNVAETYSHPLLLGSPAIGRASCLLRTDQSGAQRPTEGGCDIGAYETVVAGVRIHMPIVGKE